MTDNIERVVLIAEDELFIKSAKRLIPELNSICYGGVYARNVIDKSTGNIVPLTPKDGVICFGLGGRWKHVFEAMDNPAKMILYSSDGEILSEAEKMGVKVISKNPSTFAKDLRDMYQDLLQQK